MEFKSFPKAELLRSSNWKDFIKLSVDEVEALAQSWKEIAKENTQLSDVYRQENVYKIKRIETTMKECGVNIYNVSKHREVHAKWFSENVVKIIKRFEWNHSQYVNGPAFSSGKTVIGGIEFELRHPCDTLVKMHQAIKSAYENGISKELKSNKMLIKAIELAHDHAIDIDGLNPIQIVKEVNDFMAEEWRHENYKSGVEIDISCCSECSTWIYDEHRCSCGNRRMYLTVEGDFIDGYYAYPEAN